MANSAESQRLYLATISVDALIYVDDAPGQIGGKDVTHDEHAAWDAAAAVSLIVGDEAQEHIDDGGYPVTIAQAGVTRLRRIKPGGEVEPDWYKTKAARS